MGEAILSRGARSNEQDTTSYNAIIRANVFVGAKVTCTNGDKTYQKTATQKTIDFAVGYGTWVITSIYNSNTKTATVEVDALKIYQVTMSGSTYGISIDCSVSSPADAVTYIDDAVGFTPLRCASTGACNYGSWETIIDETFGIKPCLYNAGKVTYLNKDNYAKTEAGATADITSGSSGDVMVEFPAKWYKYSFSGTSLIFEVADYDRSADGFVQSAFLSEDGNSSSVDAFYYGAYDGYVASSKLRSLSGKTPTVNTSFSTFITNAGSTVTGGMIETFAKRMYILGLLMLVTKSRDGQSAGIGYGRVNSNSSAINTGTMNTKGLFYGRTDVYTEGVKVFGIENFWGNIYHWMAGLYTVGTSGSIAVKMAAPYGSSGTTGGTTVSGVIASGSYYWPTQYKPYMNGAVILPTLGQSTTTIGWPDYFCINSSSGYIAFVGGSWSYDLSDSGPFACVVDNSASNATSHRGARLLVA